MINGKCECRKSRLTHLYWKQIARIQTGKNLKVVDTRKLTVAKESDRVDTLIAMITTLTKEVDYLKSIVVKKDAASSERVEVAPKKNVELKKTKEIATNTDEHVEQKAPVIPVPPSKFASTQTLQLTQNVATNTDVEYISAEPKLQREIKELKRKLCKEKLNTFNLRMMIHEAFYEISEKCKRCKNSSRVRYFMAPGGGLKIDEEESKEMDECERELGITKEPAQPSIDDILMNPLFNNKL